MNIKGYDEWKLSGPDDERDRKGMICPFCGAYSTRSCELEEEMDGACPWEEMEDEGDPDYYRDLREEE